MLCLPSIAIRLLSNYSSFRHLVQRAKEYMKNILIFKANDRKNKKIYLTVTIVFYY